MSACVYLYTQIAFSIIGAQIVRQKCAREHLQIVFLNENKLVFQRAESN